MIVTIEIPDECSPAVKALDAFENQVSAAGNILQIIGPGGESLLMCRLIAIKAGTLP